MKSDSPKEVDWLLVAGWVIAVGIGAWLKIYLESIWPKDLIGTSDGDDPASFRRNIALPALASAFPPLAVVLLQSATLAWRLERFPVVAWTLLGMIASLSTMGVGMLTMNLVTVATGAAEMRNQQVWMVALGFLIAGLFVSVVQSYFLASIFRRAQIWIYLGAAYYSVWFAFVLLVRVMELPLPEALPIWVVPVVMAFAQGYWLGTEDLAEVPVPVVTRS